MISILYDDLLEPRGS